MPHLPAAARSWETSFCFCFAFRNHRNLILSEFIAFATPLCWMLTLSLPHRTCLLSPFSHALLPLFPTNTHFPLKVSDFLSNACTQLWLRTLTLLWTIPCCQPECPHCCAAWPLKCESVLLTYILLTMNMSEASVCGCVCVCARLCASVKMRCQVFIYWNLPLCLKELSYDTGFLKSVSIQHVACKK